MPLAWTSSRRRSTCVTRRPRLRLGRASDSAHAAAVPVHVPCRAQRYAARSDRRGAPRRGARPVRQRLLDRRGRRAIRVIPSPAAGRAFLVAGRRAARARRRGATASSDAVPRRAAPTRAAASRAGGDRRPLPRRRRRASRRGCSSSISHAGGRPQQLTAGRARGRRSCPSTWRRARGGGVWMLDRAARRYWALDRHLVAGVARPVHSPTTRSRRAR